MESFEWGKGNYHILIPTKSLSILDMLHILFYYTTEFLKTKIVSCSVLKFLI